jgi:catechol 2,3-dioxygenase-like lactoylglutathione lyase family enzyme
MISQLDSVVVGVNDLSAATADYAALTGSQAQEVAFRGGSSVSFQLANTCLRLVETSERHGLKQLVFGCPDLDSARRRLPNVGIEIIDEASDDGFLALNPETTRSVNLALTTARETESRDLPSAGALSGLDHAVVASGDGDFTSALLSGRLQLDMRLDLTNKNWDARLMFFRCGDLIIEVYQPLSKPLGPERDRFFGLSWRTDNIEATHAELTERGFDVSEIRTGRRPGTQVCTVRDKTHGVPTLILGRD